MNLGMDKYVARPTVFTCLKLRANELSAVARENRLCREAESGEAQPRVVRSGSPECEKFVEPS